MHPRRVSPRRPDEDRKEHIRRKAAVLFARNGYHGTGVQELSDAVGLARGALYHHIGSKEALLEEIATREVEAMIEFGEALLAEDAPAEEKLRRLSRAQMRSLADHLPEFTIFQRDAMLMRGPLRQRIIDCRDRYQAIWATIVEEGVRNGEFRAVEHVAVLGILGMHNYAYLWFREGGSMSPEEIGDSFCDLLLGGLRTGG